MSDTRRRFVWTLASLAGVARAQAPENADIFRAAAAGDIPRCTELLKADVQLVRSRSKDGNTPIHFAAMAGKPEMVMFLLGRGAELSAGAESPLIPAVDFPDGAAAAAMSETLLANGSDPNAVRSDGRSALQLALARGYPEVVRMLIHRGAEGPDKLARGVERIHPARRFTQDREGSSVKRDDTNGLPWTDINAFVTVAHFDFDKVKQLKKDNPLLLNTRSSWDELAVEAASHTGRLEMAEWLAEQGAPVSTCTAALLGASGLVKSAVEADPNCIYERGAHDIPILAYTAYAEERTEIAERLLAAGANPRARALGVTVLHVAAKKGYLEVANLLIAKGAEVNATAPSKDGLKTALDLAIDVKQSKMAGLLKDHGAKRATEL
jgi:ankyrin repeat protein